MVTYLNSDQNSITLIFQKTILADCPNKAYYIFYNIYKAAFNSSFPLKIIQISKKYIKREPWMTTGLLNSSKMRAKLHTHKT